MQTVCPVSKCVKWGHRLYIQACVKCLCGNRRMAAANGWWAGIKTHCEQTCLCLRSLDGDLTEVMYTGSYSTRRGGMITTGCPDSSPHTPGLSLEWAAGNLLSDCRPAFHDCQRRQDVTCMPSVFVLVDWQRPHMADSEYSSWRRWSDLCRSPAGQNQS